MRPATYIAISLILATAVNVTAIATKAQTQAVAWIQFSTSAHGGTVQHLTTAFYAAPTLRQAMSLCEADRLPIRNGLAKEGLKPIIEPTCSQQKPWSWID